MEHAAIPVARELSMLIQNYRPEHQNVGKGTDIIGDIKLGLRANGAWRCPARNILFPEGTRLALTARTQFHLVVCLEQLF